MNGGGNLKFDAATVRYGKGVSTPSKAQFEELLKVCKFKYEYNYELKRYEMTLVSNETGNKIVVYGEVIIFMTMTSQPMAQCISVHHRV